MQYTVNSGKRDTELLEMLSLHAFNIFFANLIEELDIHKANVIVGIHVLKKKVFKSMMGHVQKTRWFF